MIMKCLSLSLVVLCLFTAGALAQPATPQPGAAPAADAKTVQDRASYGIGMNIGRNLANEGLEVNFALVVEGIRDALQGAKPKFTEQELQAAFETFGRSVEAKRQQQTQAAGAKNKRDGLAFLAANKIKPGVKTLTSGLQYKVLQTAQGAQPKATDTVRVHYEGTLIDGTVFDSSIRRGQPAVFRVNGVIPGWTEALQRMHVGEKWRLVIPAELAYREAGAGRAIGPHAVLVFEVELLGIETGGADVRP
jgi:FKBP-type peptidyl-prolyl cis-trans isomerase FklB